VSAAAHRLGYNREQMVALTCFCFCNLFQVSTVVRSLMAIIDRPCSQAMCVSLQAPFYPKEAELKGATSTEYGLVFGVFELVVFITSPLVGPRIPKLGAPTAFTAGLLTTGSCCVLFGLLDYIQEHDWFIGLSFAVRVVEAIGNSCFLCASFSLIAQEFPSAVASVFSAVETAFGVGLILGPTVGGLMYQIGGYLLPFAVLGTILVLSAFSTLMILPKADSRNATTGEGWGAIKVLRIGEIAVFACSVLCASASIGFMLAALEPHMRDFHLKPFVMGLMFVLNGGCYAVSAPFWGKIVDKPHCNALHVNMMGGFLIFVGFSFLGPAPFLPFLHHSLANCCIGLVFHGFGIGACLVSSFAGSQRAAVGPFGGMPATIETYGAVSGMWASVFALGAFLGPSLTGWLMHRYGVQMSTLFIIAFAVLQLAVSGIYVCRQRITAARRSGYQEIGGTDVEVNNHDKWAITITFF